MLWYPLFLSLTVAPHQASTVSVRLSEWKVELSRPAIGPGPVTFIVKNAGAIPHAFEVEGKGIGNDMGHFPRHAVSAANLGLDLGLHLRRSLCQWSIF